MLLSIVAWFCDNMKLKLFVTKTFILTNSRQVHLASA